MGAFKLISLWQLRQEMLPTALLWPTAAVLHPLRAWGDIRVTALLEIPNGKTDLFRCLYSWWPV